MEGEPNDGDELSPSERLAALRAEPQPQSTNGFAVVVLLSLVILGVAVALLQGLDGKLCRGELRPMAPPEARYHCTGKWQCGESGWKAEYHCVEPAEF